MTQDNDRLEGDDLDMDGQSAGMTDKALIEHEKNGDEVLLFFRRSKTEHPEGRFPLRGQIPVREPQRIAAGTFLFLAGEVMARRMRW